MSPTFLRYERPSVAPIKIDRELSEHSPDRDSVLTIGVFDGVHRGHRRLIGHVVERARATGRLSGVVTFRNHPASVLRPGFTPRYLTSVEERMGLIEELGVDLLVPVTFDQDLGNLTAQQFVMRLYDRLNMREMVVGPGFAMGHHREGDVRTLRQIGSEAGFAVSDVDLLTDKGEDVRSTAIRNAVLEGRVSRASELLGRYFSLDGTVVRGEGRGTGLGFPTANLAVPDELAAPADGIYACWARIGEDRCMAATSIGVRPTFDGTGRTIEAFVLDFHGDLYGRTVRLEFVERLRDELRYETVQALQEQVNRDVAQARTLLAAGRR
jgi:riboflavin kinase/FMN adenylyltransferase